MDVDLLPSERLLWQGKPARHPLFETGDWFFAAIWCFIVGCGTTAIFAGDDAPLYFKVGFTAVALWLLVAKLGLRRLTVRSTEYAITDKRVLMVTKPFGSRQEYAVYLDQIGPPDLTRHGDDQGTIRFGKPAHFGRTQGSRANPSQMITLEWIPQAETVRGLILAAKAGKAP